MSVEGRFRVRAQDVSEYLKSLQSLERVYNIPGRSFYRATAAITASRASAFIMMYNCIEFGSREALVGLRQEILAGGGGFMALKDYWQEEIARAHFRDRLTQGANHDSLIRDVARFAPGVVDWKSNLRRLPFSGNVDNEELLRFVARIESRWRPPRSCLGGSDLVLIRQMRNTLAHGAETFETVGSQFSTQDITEKFRRTRIFMVSLIKGLERYKTRQHYRRV
ncbi:hypothetical protein [Mesorhizobium sp.]|uniref:hypothetical protein n=1 Tax=Mesorhizobium sp. TaxID=1871066 RepID=UPI000FE9EBA4|nr:hypothetical protein [Mesorhizobium sp.]RWK49761.1 MAG: hypothetical protein EOR48_28485 [Mesorhizobium sp.]